MTKPGMVILVLTVLAISCNARPNAPEAVSVLDDTLSGVTRHIPLFAGSLENIRQHHETETEIN